MNRRLTLGIALLALAFCALPILASPADPLADAYAAIFAPPPDAGGSPSQPQDAAKRPHIKPKATCTAICGNGSTVSCSGVTCAATNASCPGQQGSCTADGVTTPCSACPATTCTVTATCSPSGSVSCSSNNNDCLKINNCYAECDGVIHWCPRHGSCPV